MKQAKDLSEAEVIEACNNFHRNPMDTTHPSPDVALQQKGYPQKVVLEKMRKMVKRGILEYGVSLRTAWVKKGITKP